MLDCMTATRLYNCHYHTPALFARAACATIGCCNLHVLTCSSIAARAGARAIALGSACAPLPDDCSHERGGGRDASHEGAGFVLLGWGSLLFYLRQQLGEGLNDVLVELGAALQERAAPHLREGKAFIG
jgi:hypothetical protein